MSDLLEREQLLFDQLRQKVSVEATRMQASAGSLAALDVLAGLAELLVSRTTSNLRYTTGTS